MSRTLQVLGAVVLAVALFAGGALAGYGTNIGGYMTVKEWGQMHSYYLNGYTQGVADAMVSISDPDLYDSTVRDYASRAAACIRSRQYHGDELRQWAARNIADKSDGMQLASVLISVYAECP
jgi:hypothetical protein